MMNAAMGTVALIGCVSVLAAGLAGCGRSEPQTMGGDQAAEYRTYRNGSVALWIDPDTKCEYISGGTSSAMTPRLNRDGKHICR